MELAKDLPGVSHAISSEMNVIAMAVIKTLHREKIESEVLLAQSTSKATLRIICLSHKGHLQVMPCFF